jgi:hypothetical protein
MILILFALSQRTEQLPSQDHSVGFYHVTVVFQLSDPSCCISLFQILNETLLVNTIIVCSFKQMNQTLHI